MDFLKGPRSKPPLQEARLDIWKSPRSNIPQRSKRPSKGAASGQRKVCFLRDLQVICMRFLRAWRLGCGLSKGPRSNPPPTGGSVGPMQRSKHQGPTTPFERVDWTFQPVQGPWWGVPYTRGVVLQSDARISGACDTRQGLEASGSACAHAPRGARAHAGRRACCRRVGHGADQWHC